MKEKIRTKPNLIDSSPEHQLALQAGNDHYASWTYNVIDKFKGMSVEDIRSELDKTAFPFAVCFEHLINDFNMGTAIRNANAFGAREVFYVGDKKWDRRAAMGVHNYTSVKWLPTIDDFIKLKEKYVIIGIDNVPGSVSISSYRFPKNTLMVFGEEGVGLTPMMRSLCQDIVHIDMFGSVRSLNCGTASGIAMFAYTQQCANS